MPIRPKGALLRVLLSQGPGLPTVRRSTWRRTVHDLERQPPSKRACRTKKSKEARKQNKTLFSPKALNEAMEREFKREGWKEQRTSYWVTDDAQLIRKTMGMNEKTQKQEILAAGATPHPSYNQTDFVKNRVAVEIQFGKYSFVAYDLFVKHMAFFVGNEIDVGVEILAMKEMQAEMSSGPGYYEGELYNLIRQGRGVPAVPLIIVGVAP